jgi:mannose-6-phosphate isomerase-like protein (cupin superfamily)
MADQNLTIIRSAEALRFEVPGVSFTAAAAPSRGSKQVCTWRIAVQPGLQSPEGHVLDADEVFMVQTGTIKITPEAPPVHAGDTVVVAAGSPIQLINPTDEIAEVVIAVTAGFVATSADGTPIGTPPWAL